MTNNIKLIVFLFINKLRSFVYFEIILKYNSPNRSRPASTRTVKSSQSGTNLHGNLSSHGNSSCRNSPDNQRRTPQQPVTQQNSYYGDKEDPFDDCELSENEEPQPKKKPPTQEVVTETKTEEEKVKNTPNKNHTETTNNNMKVQVTHNPPTQNTNVQNSSLQNPLQNSSLQNPLQNPLQNSLHSSLATQSNPQNPLNHIENSQPPQTHIPTNHNPPQQNPPTRNLIEGNLISSAVDKLMRKEPQLEVSSINVEVKKLLIACNSKFY